ncbi:MATE family efflux transporter [Labilibaculum antarcticum]|uniref:Multidrug-efflux transporter n=1 Tax=Labilibaculum antarcticum TaxID=1717717 RepID=A0A1Y1CM55_9BACT|nr:MATE family efflux transporter [Labilibaculum antarcticum]BAX81374.1 MATE family efflux transporter [Labilibaculum antarcticum]
MKTQTNYRSIWKISYPIILGSLAQNIIALTDTAFLGHLSETALGAAAIATIFYFAIVMLAWGFGLGVQIVIARRVGEGNLKLVGKTFDHALFFLLILAVVLIGFMELQAPPILKAIVKSNAIYDASMEYISYRAWGIIFACVNLLFRAFYIGIAKTKIIGWSTVFMAIINVFFDYVLIFGEWGFPEMGIKGAAVASVIAEVFVMVFFIVYTLRKVPVKTYELFKFIKIDWELYTRLIKVSFPMMIQNFLALSCWFIFFLMVERMGERELAISNIIRSIYVLMMVPVWSFASAANTLVSQVIGEGAYEEVMPVIWRTVKLSFFSVLALVGICIINPELVISIYTEEISLIAEAKPVLYVVFGATLIFPIAVTLFHGVSGTGNTFHAMLLEMAVLVCYLGAVYLLIVVFKSSISGVWTTEYFYAGFMGLSSWLYLKYANWKESNI